jgi:hypothetical protein
LVSAAIWFIITSRPFTLTDINERLLVRLRKTFLDIVRSAYWKQIEEGTLPRNSIVAVTLLYSVDVGNRFCQYFFFSRLHYSVFFAHVCFPLPPPSTNLDYPRYKLGLILTRNCHNLTRIFTIHKPRLFTLGIEFAAVPGHQDWEVLLPTLVTQNCYPKTVTT